MSRCTLMRCPKYCLSSRRVRALKRRSPWVSLACLLRWQLCLALATSAAHATAEDPSLLSESRNFHAISDSLLTSGQIYSSQMAALQEQGIELVVNLAVADPERNKEEPFAVMNAGINYVNIPVLWGEPSREDLELFFSMMDARGTRPTLVHCFANYRASAFTYLYRVIREGIPEARAREDLMAVWTDEKFAENPAWRSFIDQMLETYL